MIDFKEELEKYKPALMIDEVEASIKSDEVKDVMEMLQYISKKMSNEKE